MAVYYTWSDIDAKALFYQVYMGHRVETYLQIPAQKMGLVTFDFSKRRSAQLTERGRKVRELMLSRNLSFEDALKSVGGEVLKGKQRC